MYAKDFFKTAKLLPDPGLCFIIMPFALKFDQVWQVIRETVTGQPFNLLCRRADDITRPGHVLTDVLENIVRSRLLIADLSDQNPNVFYELGLAHSIKEADQVILIASEETSIPFDLRQLRCIIYNDDLERNRSLCGAEGIILGWQNML